MNEFLPAIILNVYIIVLTSLQNVGIFNQESFICVLKSQRMSTGRIKMENVIIKKKFISISPSRQWIRFKVLEKNTKHKIHISYRKFLKLFVHADQNDLVYSKCWAELLVCSVKTVLLPANQR